MAGSRRSSRALRHLPGNAVVVGYLGAAAVAGLARSDWLAVHLALLGAATNAIVLWGEHFASAALRAPTVSPRAAGARLLALNAGVLASLTGVATDVPALTCAGAGLVVAVVAAHAWWLRAALRRALPARLSPTVPFYVDAAGFLGVGALLGALLGTGALEGGVEHGAHVAHVHANVLGWVGLTVLGTLVPLWPTVLRTRMTDAAVPLLRRARPFLDAGLALAVVALLAGQPRLAAVGVAGYAVGLGIVLVPFLATARQRPPIEAASWFLALGVGWYAVAVVADVGLLAGGRDGLSELVPVLGAGFVAQVLVGALSFLLPVVLGGGPSGNRRLAALLETGWIARAAATNAGVLVLALPTGEVAHRAGQALVLVGLGAFVPLAAVALARGARIARERTGLTPG